MILGETVMHLKNTKMCYLILSLIMFPSLICGHGIPGQQAVHVHRVL